MVETLEPFLLASFAYILCTAIPGPSTLLIATTSMRSGRSIGLAAASGVLVGTLVWGILAGAGVVTAMNLWVSLTKTLRVVGGLYLLWLSAKSIRSALSEAIVKEVSEKSPRETSAAFRRGLLVHLTNPKTALAWIAAIAIGTSTSTSGSSEFAFVVVAICWCAAIVIYCGYALAFASARVTSFYIQSRRKVDTFAALVFGATGLLLLLG